MSIELPLDSMSVAEKLQAMEALWASLCSNPVDVASPEWHGRILEERRKRMASGETTVTDWSDAKKRLQDLGR
jgi:hypothetical protein